MNATEHDRYRDDVGAYLLGALDDGERSEFERHASICHVCQDEIDRLRMAADALPRSVEQYEPPPSLKQALMERVNADGPSSASAKPARRRFRFQLPRLAVAASAAALLIGVAVGYALSSGGGDNGATTISAAVDARNAGNARAVVVAGSSGSQVRVSAMPRLPPGQVYEVWTQRGKRIVPGPLFTVDRSGNGVGAVPGGLGGVDAVMVTRERAGGALQPTGPTMLVART